MESMRGKPKPWHTSAGPLLSRVGAEVATHRIVIFHPDLSRSPHTLAEALTEALNRCSPRVPSRSPPHGQAARLRRRDERKTPAGRDGNAQVVKSQEAVAHRHRQRRLVLSARVRVGPATAATLKTAAARRPFLPSWFGYQSRFINCGQRPSRVSIGPRIATALKKVGILYAGDEMRGLVGLVALLTRWDNIAPHQRLECREHGRQEDTGIESDEPPHGVEDAQHGGLDGHGRPSRSLSRRARHLYGRRRRCRPTGARGGSHAVLCTSVGDAAKGQHGAAIARPTERVSLAPPLMLLLLLLLRLLRPRGDKHSEAPLRLL